MVINGQNLVILWLTATILNFIIVFIILFIKVDHRSLVIKIYNARRPPLNNILSKSLDRLFKKKASFFQLLIKLNSNYTLAVQPHITRVSSCLGILDINLAQNRAHIYIFAFTINYSFFHLLPWIINSFLLQHLVLLLNCKQTSKNVFLKKR